MTIRSEVERLRTRPHALIGLALAIALAFAVGVAVKELVDSRAAGAVAWLLVLGSFPVISIARARTRGEVMTPRPRSWDELRRRVLEEDYLTLEKLEEQQALAGSLKHVIWLNAFFIAAFVALLALGAVGVLEVVAFALIVGGNCVVAWSSARQERRWEELIREREAVREADASNA